MNFTAVVTITSVNTIYGSILNNNIVCLVCLDDYYNNINRTRF